MSVARLETGRGFGDPVIDSQAVFRAVMDAFAAPARAVVVRVPSVEPPSPLSAMSAAIILALCDFETTVWLDPALAGKPDVEDYIRFHTGAVLVDDPARAAFAMISDLEKMPPLDAFAQGNAEYPDQSTTLILQVDALSATGAQFEGPGFQTRRRFEARPMPTGFERQWQGNTALFPRGVDLIFAAPNAIAALPRSSRLVEEASCT